MTRLEGGVLKLRKEPAEVRDLVGAALTQLGDRVRGRSIQVDVPDELPFVSLDFVLMSRALVNLLDNAIKYSPPERPIEIHARTLGENLVLEVADRGPGIPESTLPSVFDRRYWARHTRMADGGMGLGLAICKGFVEAHGGEIKVKNRLGGGLRILVTIPVRRATPDARANPGGGTRRFR
jgi:two-component system sensor histidine kinase KdpD